jgi:hypothetical protein
MTTMACRIFPRALAVLAFAACWGCRDAPLAENINTNETPFARAGEMQVLDYSGSPVSVTLDGSESYDADGKIETYRWFSGTRAADGGIGRAGPDPDDVESPTVKLDAGTWIFTLFVIDNEGGISLPASVSIQVGSVAPDPKVAACASAALQSVSEDCRLCLCGIDDTCRMATTSCTGDCWSLLFCVDSQCADVDPNDSAAYASCATGMCSAFLAGGGLASQALTPCRNRPACATLCSASAQGQ